MSHKPEDVCRQHLPKFYSKKNVWATGMVWCCPDCNRLWYVSLDERAYARGSDHFFEWKPVKGENK